MKSSLKEVNYLEGSLKDAVVNYTMDKILEKIELRKQGNRTIKWSDHAHDKLTQIGLKSRDILEAMPNGKVIEVHWEYAFDMVKVVVYLDSMDKPIHVVLLMSNDYFKIKTVYIVDYSRYLPDNKSRRRL